MLGVRQVFSVRPAPAPAPAPKVGVDTFALLRVATECTIVCTTCADALLDELDPMPLRDVIGTNLDCADVCAETDRLLSRPDSQDQDTLRAQLVACMTMCRTCAEACDRHGSGREHCRVCARSCRACAEACDAMIGSLAA